MKICTVYGDMSSEKSGENYPTDLYCDECFNEMNPGTESSAIVTWTDDDGSYGDTCLSCHKTKEEEIEEQKTY